MCDSSFSLISFPITHINISLEFILYCIQNSLEFWRKFSLVYHRAKDISVHDLMWFLVASFEFVNKVELHRSRTSKNKLASGFSSSNFWAAESRKDLGFTIHSLDSWRFECVKLDETFKFRDLNKFKNWHNCNTMLIDHWTFMDSAVISRNI